MLEDINFFMYQVDTTWNFQKDFHSLFHCSQYFVILVPCEYFKCKIIDSSMSANILYDVLSYLKNFGFKEFFSSRRLWMDFTLFCIFCIVSLLDRMFFFVICFLFCFVLVDLKISFNLETSDSRVKFDTTTNYKLAHVGRFS